jgi:LPS sulfotransferase NodH
MTSPIYDLATAAHDYPVWDGTPLRHILMCTHPRSGSTLLGEAFHFSSALGCPLEYFHVGFRPSFAQRWNAHDIDCYIAAVRRHRTGPNGTLAVKLFWRDVEELAQELDPERFPESFFTAPEQMDSGHYGQLAALLTALFPNMALVHLSRRDRVRQAVSASLATTTGKWRNLNDGGSSALTSPQAYDRQDIERLIGYSDYCHRHWHNLFDALRIVPFTVRYEQLVSDYAKTIADVFAQLGCSVKPVPIRMQRQADARSETMVIRYLREQSTPSK